jgi:predicted transcriptional regulator
MSSLSENVDVKDAAIAVIQSLPENATWDEVQYSIYVKQQIELGLADSEAGRLIDTHEMRRRLAEKKGARL